MEKSLISLNEAIRCINNPDTNQEQVEKRCQKIQHLLQKFEKKQRQNYLLYLAEVYAIRLFQIEKGQKICQQMLSSFCNESKIGSYLRRGFFFFLDQNYERAQWNRQKAFSQCKLDVKLNEIVYKFDQRVLQSLESDKIAQAISKELQHNYEGAEEIYNEELNSFEATKISNRYFAAKALYNLYTSSTLKKVSKKKSPQQCTQIMDSIIEQKQIQMNFDQHSIQERLNKQYLNRKNYIQALNSPRNLLHSNFNDVEKDRKIIQFIAELKLKKAKHELEASQNPEGVQIIQSCLKDIKSDQIDRKMLQKYTNDTLQSINRVEKILSKKKRVFQFARAEAFTFIMKFSSERRQKQPQPSRNMMISKPNISMTMSKPFTQKIDENFTGSYMEKVHENSDGTKKRYFYFQFDQIKKDKFYLYFADKKNEKSKNNDYYKIHTLEKVRIGKKSSALQRKECSEFDNQLCFSLKLEERERSFFVKNKKDFSNWIRLFYSFLSEVKKKEENGLEKSKASRTKKVVM